MNNSSIVYEPSKTTHWRNLFENKSMLLGSHNLNEGEELIAIINGASIQSIKDRNGKDNKVPVLTFTNAPPMVLNITNTKTIAMLYGDLCESWPGKSIQLYSTKVRDFGGGFTTGLRIRPQIPTNGIDLKKHINELKSCSNINQLKSVFMGLPKNVKAELTSVKDSVKEKLGESDESM